MKQFYFILTLLIGCSKVLSSSPEKEEANGNLKNLHHAPKMTFEVDIDKVTSSKWKVVRERNSPEGLNYSYIPVPENDDNYTQQITKVVGINTDLQTYLNRWIMGLSVAGATVTTQTIPEEKSVLVVYKTRQENGFWKFSEGVDGTYGIGYCFRPERCEAKDIEQWIKTLKEIRLTEQ